MKRLPTRMVPIAIAMFLTPFVAAACDDDEPVVETGEEVETTIDDTIYDEEYGVYEADEFDELESAATLGRTVTVNANVTRVVEEGKAFLTGDPVVGNELLVLVTPKVKDLPALAEGDDILVVGKVVEFVSTDIESANEPFDLDNDLYGDFEDNQAILAQTVINLSGAEASPPADSSTTTTAQTGQ